jgi:cytochrome c oxidase assembly factor CtaG
MSNYTIGTALTRWTFNLPVSVAIIVILAAYLLAVRAARSRDTKWPLWRTAAFIVLGLGSVVLCTMSSLAVYDHTLFWPLALQLVFLISIVPVCLSLGDPLGLVGAALSPAGRTHWERALRSPVARAITFPVVTPLVALALQMVVFFSGYLTAALHHAVVMDLLYLNVLVVGCVVALPLLGVELLPLWCTDPLRMLFACVDGLLDAIPGVALLTSSSLVAGGYYANVSRTWGPSPLRDQHLGGALILTVAEVIAMPLLGILFFRWARNDMSQALVLDEERPVAQRTSTGGELLEKPWWETEARGRLDDSWPRKPRTKTSRRHRNHDHPPE